MIDRRAAAQWNLFADWCAAVGEQPLRAGPLTVARFLGAHPAADATQRRRVTAINAVHRRQGHPPPGQAHSVREAIDERSRRRRHARAAAAVGAIAALPRGKGWPTTLFARRDAMILALAGAGLAGVDIAQLRLGDVREAPAPLALEVAVRGERRTVTVDSAVAGMPATRIWRDWDEIRRVQHQLPANRWTQRLLDGQAMPPLRPAPAELPLLTPLDRWGATPLGPAGLSADSIAAIIRSHLAGAPRMHRPLRPKADGVEVAVVEPEGAPVVEEVSLDPETVERGLAARKRSAALLDGVTDALDDVEARAEALLAGLLELLEEPEPQRINGSSPDQVGSLSGGVR